MAPNGSIVCGSFCILSLDDENQVWLYGTLSKLRGPFIGPLCAVKQSINIISMACGSIHWLGLDGNGNVWGMGNNQLGISGFISNPSEILEPTLIPIHTEIVSIHCGYRCSFCIDNRKLVYGFGENENYQIGVSRGITNSKTIKKPTIIPYLDSVIHVESGFCQSFFQKEDGTVFVCGSNDRGRLGMGDVRTIITPLQNPLLSDICIIRCGSVHALALSNNDELFIMGFLPWNFLSAKVPTRISIDNTSKIENIYCGERHSMVLESNKTVWAMGTNEFNIIGLGINKRECGEFCKIDTPDICMDIIPVLQKQ